MIVYASRELDLLTILCFYPARCLRADSPKAQAAAHGTIRSPSATMAFVLTSQLQFLATLSFVDDTGVEGSALSGLTNNLRSGGKHTSFNVSAGLVDEQMQ